MAIRIKLATLFSLTTTLFLILEHVITNYSKIKLFPFIDCLPRELIEDLGCFIILAVLNYLISGPIVKPIMKVLTMVDSATKGKLRIATEVSGDELRLLEQGFEQIADTIDRQDKHIDHIHEELNQKNEDLNTLFKNTIAALEKAVYARDPYTASHSKNVMRYARALSEKLQLPETEIYYLEIGALLHDIGKIGVPEHVLMKTSRLTDVEFDLIKKHPEYGYEIINEIEELKSRGVHEIVLHHHERMDGNGYPEGLKGEEIPLHARIVSICDAFDAMTTSRSYRPALDINTAISQLKIHSGDQFDANMVEAFIRCIEDDPTLFQPLKQDATNQLLASL